MSSLKEMVIMTQRMTGFRKPIAIIDPMRYQDAFQAIESLQASVTLRAFMAVCLSAGLRVSEGLSLQRSQVNLDTGEFKVAVLKKHLKAGSHQEIRHGLLHPVALKLLKEHLLATGGRHFDRLFHMNRFVVYREVRNAMGEKACPHSLRHSYVSWLLHTKKLTAEDAAALVHIKLGTVRSYSHVNELAVLKQLQERSAS